jgi:flagellar biosynthesis protein FliR
MNEAIISPSAYINAFVRASAFAATTPLVGSGAIPRTVRAALALALTPILASHLASTGAASKSAQLAIACLDSAVIGAAFGLAATMVASAAAAAGSVTDAALSSQAVSREPVFGSAGGPFATLFALGFAATFMASGAMTHLCARFVIASSALELTTTLRGAVTLVRACANSALELATPAIVGQVLGTAIAAVVSRAAPRINGLMLASPVVTAVILLSVISGAAATFARLASLARAAASLGGP